MVYFFSLLTSLAVTMALIPPLIKLAYRAEILDLPDERKVHMTAIPRIGGIAIAIGFFIPLLLWLPITREYISFLLGLTVILVFGVLDDYFELGFGWKFLGQLIAVSIVVFFGGIHVTHLPMMGFDEMPSYLAIPFTILALVGVTNAINLADGLDGLAGGQVLLSLVAVALLAYLANGQELVIICLALSGAVLGFLRFNTYPARIFMGDGGSQFLGFSIGFLVIYLSQQVHAAISPVVVIFLLGLPIIDTLTVMIQRLYERRSLFVADKNHLHHKLLKLGLDHYEAVLIIYCAQALLISVGYLLRYQPDYLLIIVYAGFFLLVLGFFYLAGRYRWRLAAGQPLRESFLKRQVASLRESGLVPRVITRSLQALTISLFLIVAVGVEDVPKDIAMASLVLAGGSMSLLLMKKMPLYLAQMVIYVTAVFTVYLLAGASREMEWGSHVIFSLLALGVLVGIRLTRGNDFRVTPMDFLIIFIAVLVPALPDLGQINSALTTGIPRAIILFYALEFILHGDRRSWLTMQWGAVLALFLAAVRGLL